MRVERLQNDFQTVYRLPEEAPCPMVQKEEFGIPKKKNSVFLHDNVPSHAARFTTKYLASVFGGHGKIIEWPACSPDLNPIENLQSILKRKIYFCGRQYT